MISTPAASTPVQRFLAPKQAAHWLSVSPKLLSKMRTSGGGPAFTYVGRLVRYSNAELGKWVTRQPRTGTKSGPAQ